MPRTGWTPSIVPKGDDQNVYLVVDDFGRNGRAYREADVETTDQETVIADLDVLGRRFQRRREVVARSMWRRNCAIAAISNPRRVFFPAGFCRPIRRPSLASGEQSCIWQSWTG
jgi:hypothetical protein